MNWKLRKRLATLALITALLIPSSAFAAGPDEVSCEGVAVLVEAVQSERGRADLDCNYNEPTP